MKFLNGFNSEFRFGGLVHCLEKVNEVMLPWNLNVSQSVEIVTFLTPPRPMCHHSISEYFQNMIDANIKPDAQIHI